MDTLTSITLSLGKLDQSTVPARYPLTLSWQEGGAEKSVEEFLPEDLTVPPHTGDYRSYRKTFVARAGESAEFHDIGRHLFDLLHQGKVGRQLEDLRQGKGESGRLRVLLDVREPELALLPWELMFDGGALRPFQDTEDTFARVWNYDPRGQGRKAESLGWPIRLLVVTGVSAEESRKIAAEQEIMRIEDALRPVKWLVDVYVCEQATVNELERVCREFRPHVFHYIGHGGVDQNDNSYIVLQNPGGGDTTWTAAQIKSGLGAWGWAPRVAFINACRSAAAPGVQQQTTSWAIGDAFRALGVPAVLTMQADVKGAPAGEFAGMLYEKLADGEPVDRALAAARIRMRDNTEAMDKDAKRDWATPTLTLSIPPENVLPLRAQIKCRHEQEISCELFDMVSVLAGRRPDRRQFIHSIYPIPPRQPDKELIFVLGGKQIGKTWLTLSCLESYARKGHDVRYVEVAAAGSPKWLDVLLHIQTGDPLKAVAGKHPLIFRPLDPAAFGEFNYELPYRLRNEKPPDWGGVAAPPPAGLNTDDLDNLPEATVAEIFKSFRKALVAAAEPDNPLIIVLDKFTDAEGGVTAGHMNKFLLPLLFEKAAAGDLVARDAAGARSVKLVLVVNEDEWETYNRHSPKPSLNDLRRYAYEVYLEGIPAADYDKVAQEFFRNLVAGPPPVRRYMRRVSEAMAQNFINGFRPQDPGPWKPGRLKMIQSIFERLEDM